MTATPSGFAAVATAPSAVGAVASGLGKAAAGSEGAGGGGLFATLLALLDAASVTPNTSVTTTTSAALPDASASITTSTTLGTTGGSQDPKSLLQELSDALAAVAQSVENGSPVGPALRKKLDDTVNALAGLLGIQLLQSATPPAAEGSAAGNSAIAAVQDALGNLMPTAGLAGSADPASGSGASFPDAAGGSASPSTNSPTPQPTTAQIAARLHELSAALGQTAPALAKKLESVADGLDDPDTQALVTRLGLDKDLKPLEKKLEAALGSLAKAPVPSVGSAPQPQAFGAPNLSAPADTTSASTGDTAQDATGTGTRHGLEPPAADKPVTTAAKATDSKSADTGGSAASGTQAAQATATPASTDASQPGAGSGPAAVDPAASAAATQAQQPAGITPIADARLAQAAYQPATPAIPYPQVAFEVARQFAAGNSRFQIRLDPPELGRIDVKMDVDKHGTVTARMTVDKAETLDLMQRDRGTLERALQQAGLDGAKTNLQFSLRQNPSGHNGSGQQQPSYTPARTPAIAEAAPPAIPISIYRATASPGGVNLFV